MTEETSPPYQWAQQYITYRSGREALDRAEKKAKDALMEYLSLLPTDDRGNAVFTLPEPIDGYEGFKRERRVTQSLDEEQAMRLVEEFAIEDGVEIVYVVNEDAILAANFAGLVPDDAVKALYSSKETFALVPIKVKK